MSQLVLKYKIVRDSSTSARWLINAGSIICGHVVRVLALGDIQAYLYSENVNLASTYMMTTFVFLLII